MSAHPELPYWLALRRAGLGSTNFALLLARFSTISAAWEAPIEAVSRAGLEPQYVRAVAKARAAFAPGSEEAWLERLQVRAYTWLDADYPAPLREIPQSPPVLFVRGAAGPHFDQAVAVVGTRHVTPYGRQAAEHFCEALARSGAAIISGLARGVDAIAHRVALEQGGPTAAVLAGGVDQVYPRENAGLAARIMETGCLVSEYPAGIPARPDYFPRRNRILSGLAKATLIVEAGEGSGALHTANWAFEQGRDVFAIPGSIFSRQSTGTNQLIRESTAKLVATPEQLCEELNLIGQRPLPGLAENAPAAAPAPPAPGTDEEEAILALLAAGPVHIDTIARETGIPVAAASAALQLLELKGLVSEGIAMTYQRA